MDTGLIVSIAVVVVFLAICVAVITFKNKKYKKMEERVDKNCYILKMDSSALSDEELLTLEKEFSIYIVNLYETGWYYAKTKNEYRTALKYSLELVILMLDEIKKRGLE